jgi:polyisoprenoid-binding protein YceI
MKNKIDRQVACCAASLLLLSGVRLFAADGPVRYQAPPNASLVRVQGTSPLHDWEMKGTSIGGFVEFANPVQFDTNQATPAGLQDGKLAVKVHAIVPIGAVHSEALEMPDTMDNLMQSTMKADQFRTIQYTTTALKLKTPHAAGTPFEFDADGELTIAGVTNKVSFPVTIAPSATEKDNITISGQAKVKMTDYGVKPPAPNFGLGMMKCGDDVIILFDWTLAPKKP